MGTALPEVQEDQVVLEAQHQEVLLEVLLEDQLEVLMEGQLEGQLEVLLVDMLEVQWLGELVNLEVLEQCLGKDPVLLYAFLEPWQSHERELVDFLQYNDKP